MISDNLKNYLASLVAYYRNEGHCPEEERIVEIMDSYFKQLSGEEVSCLMDLHRVVSGILYGQKLND